MTWVAEKTLRSFIGLGLFVALYIIGAYTSNAIVGGVAIFLAHISSNVVFVVGLYDLQKTFNTANIARATASMYQIYTGTALCASLLAARLAEVMPPVCVISFGLFIVLILRFVIFLFPQKFQPAVEVPNVE